MRRVEKEIKDRSTIEEILQRAVVCRLAVCEGNTPYIVPLNFGYKRGRLYFHSAPEGRKIEAIKANPNICFEVDVDLELVPDDIPCDWTVRYRSVIGFGRAHLLERTEEKREALDVILGHYAQGPFEYTQEAVAQVAIIEVEIESLTGKQSGY
ncbi:MAG TPA: pyridoxamine 5'-phosphate oxidase family protein [Chloroflexi bacterium]|nr:pyridoxamine 5'-phosphate oxidase family protein [Chloroflexota bacterium]